MEIIFNFEIGVFLCHLLRPKCNTLFFDMGIFPSVIHQLLSRNNLLDLVNECFPVLFTKPKEGTLFLIWTLVFLIVIR